MSHIARSFVVSRIAWEIKEQCHQQKKVKTEINHQYDSQASIDVVVTLSHRNNRQKSQGSLSCPV